MKKSLLFITVFLMIIFGYFFYQSKSTGPVKTVVQKNLTVYLKLQGENNFLKSSELTGKTALDLTKEKANVKTKGEGTNAYVTEINGVSDQTSKKEYWALYLNGKMAEVGAGSYQLKDGDKIEWKLVKY